eukprot:6668093-Prymnesium_polylepis.1
MQQPVPRRPCGGMLIKNICDAHGLKPLPAPFPAHYPWTYHGPNTPWLLPDLAGRIYLHGEGDARSCRGTVEASGESTCDMCLTLGDNKQLLSIVRN